MDRDLRSIAAKGFKEFLSDNESALLSDAFWDVRLVQNLETSSTNSPYFNTFLAAQIFAGDRSLLSNSSKVSDLISVTGDVHHIFPREYLKKNGFNDRWQYNQVANYAYLDTGVNISIGMKAPNDYFSAAYAQCNTGDIAVGTITSKNVLLENLAANCIPANIENMTAEDYPEFLRQRRTMMAKKIREYYYSL